MSQPELLFWVMQRCSRLYHHMPLGPLKMTVPSHATGPLKVHAPVRHVHCVLVCVCVTHLEVWSAPQSCVWLCCVTVNAVAVWSVGGFQRFNWITSAGNPKLQLSKL